MSSKPGLRWIFRFLGFRQKAAPQERACCRNEMAHTAVEFFEWWEHNKDRMASRSERDLFHVIEMSEGSRWN